MADEYEEIDSSCCYEATGYEDLTPPADQEYTPTFVDVDPTPSREQGIPVAADIVLKPSLHYIAGLLGLTDTEFVNKVLTERQSISVDFSPKLKNVICTTLPGGLWGIPPEVGAPDPNDPYQGTGRYLRHHPSKRARLMVVCPCPSLESTSRTMLPVDELSPIIGPIITQTDIEPDDVYVAYAVPFFPEDGKIASSFITAFRPILLEAIRRTNPEAILVLGSYSLKALFGTKGIVNSFYGKTDAEFDGIPVHYTVDPYKLLTNPKSTLTLKADLSRIIPALGGEAAPWDSVQDYKRYSRAESVDAVRAVVIDAMAKYVSNGNKLRLAVDLEWGNLDGRDGIDHDVVRYIQFSWAAHTGVVCVLTDPELEPLPGHAEKLRLIKSLFELPGVELAGHNFKIDLLHLMRLGIDCRDNFAFDTMTAYHFLQPQSDLIGLEAVSLKYTDLGRYDLPLGDYLKGSGLSSHVKVHGYSKIPDEILFTYACCDVDAVMQAWPKIEDGLRGNPLDARYCGYELNGVKIYNQLDVYYNLIKLADEGIFEPEYYGLPVDRDLMIRLQKLFSSKLLELKASIYAAIPWDGFDPDKDNLKGYLFGRSFYNPKEEAKRVPEWIQTLDMVPVKTTGKYPTPWEELDQEELETANPSTDGDSLKILIGSYPEHQDILQLIMDYKALNQILKNFLRPPDGGEDGDEEVYNSGWISRVDDDGVIRGTYLQTTETGRFRSLKPNLNNMSSGEAEYDVRKLFATKPEFFEADWKKLDTRELIRQGLLHPDYDILRSVVRAKPGYVIIGADISQAELRVLAGISGDAVMLAALNDPARDLHSETALHLLPPDQQPPEGVSAKQWIQEKGLSAIRNSAKAVLFGLIYGRGCKAVKGALNAAGIDADIDYAKKIIADVLEAYPKVAEYIKTQHKAVTLPGYAENPFGMRRYFFKSPLNSVMAAQCRESVNAPIQSSVSGVLYRAMANLTRYKREHPDINYRVILPFHDAAYSMVWWEDVERYINEVVPYCMVENAGIPSIGLSLKVDVECMFHWGHKCKPEQAIVESLACLYLEGGDPSEVEK